MRSCSGSLARRGFLFALALVFGLVMVILAFGLFFMVNTESKLTNRFVDYTYAQQIAEAGIDQVLFYAKAHKKTNETLLAAIKDGKSEELTIPKEALAEIKTLKQGHGLSDIEIKASFEPTPSPFPGMGVYTGNIRIQSRGVFTNPQGQKSMKQILSVFGVRAIYMGIVAPEHGLFIREKEHLNYKFEDSIMPSDLAVFNGNVYVKNGMTAELSDYNLQNMIKKNEMTWEEYYYIDHPPKSTGLKDGGVDFLDAKAIEYESFGVFRQFNMFGQPVKEKYSTKTTPIDGFWNNEQIRLRNVDFYKTMAKTRLEPRVYTGRGNERDDRLFKDIIFEGERGFNSVRYNKVLPLYGYGDWRYAPLFDPKRYGPRSRKDDFRNAFNVDGITFVRGDVFLEGYYEGVGILAVQGNVYLGGSLRALDKNISGHPSLLNVIIFEDPSRETGSGPTNHDSFKKTGHLIFKPHPDNDWSQAGGEDPDRNVKNDAAVYCQNGVQEDKEAWRDNSADLGTLNVDFKHNLVTETVNMNFMPHDMILNGKNPNDEFIEAGGQGLNDFLQLEINAVMKAWVVESIEDESQSLGGKVEGES